LAPSYVQKRGFHLAQEASGLRRYLLDQPGLVEVPCIYTREDLSPYALDHHGDPPRQPFRVGGLSCEPAMHLLIYGGGDHRPNDPYQVSREVLDRIGEDWEFPSELFMQFQATLGYGITTYTSEYEVPWYETNSSTDQYQPRSPFPRFISVAVEDFSYVVSAFVMRRE
jgi:hypothetical protein